MAGFRFSLVLLSALVFADLGRTQYTPRTPSSNLDPLHGKLLVDACCTDTAVSKVYSLADLGDDPNLCKWIAETIPQMIKPGCWTGKNLCYYAPAKVMAIHQTPDVHAKVEEFLATMRKSLPREKTAAMRHDPQVAPAQFNPEPLRPIGPPCAAMAYPVPGPMQTPKHLFHFIIRYEGEGIIDSNVTKFTEALTKGAAGLGGDQSSSGAQNYNAPPGMPIAWSNAVPIANAPKRMPSAEGEMPPLRMPSPTSPRYGPAPSARPPSPPTLQY